MKILILSQYANISPHDLSVNPIPFEDLCHRALRGVYDRQDFVFFRPAEVREVDETFRPEERTTVFRAGEDGRAEIWLYRWDAR